MLLHRAHAYWLVYTRPDLSVLARLKLQQSSRSSIFVDIDTQQTIR